MHFSGDVAEEIRIMPPSDALITLAALRQKLWNARHNTGAELKSWMENIQVCGRSAFNYGTYEEWQQDGDETTARLCTAICQE